MSSVLVVDAAKRPQDPVHPGTARWLLSHGKAAVWRRYPFTIILKHAAPDAHPAPLRVKLDPGSKTTGLALLNDRTGQITWAGEIAHRGQRIRDALLARKVLRRGRRQRKTRYRPPRFNNRRRPEGWLPPSLESRISNVLTWVARLARLAPVGAITQEVVKFDMQLLERPEISGVEYQQGELAGYEVREYLLEKFGRTCVYCGATGAQQVPLQVEHIVPRSRGGSHRVSNLTIACAMQPSQGQQNSGRVQTSRGPGASQAPAQRCGGGQREPVGIVPSAPDYRAARGSGHRGAHQVEPHPAGAAQDPLAGCRVRRC